MSDKSKQQFVFHDFGLTTEENDSLKNQSACLKDGYKSLHEIGTKKIDDHQFIFYE